MQIYKAVVYRDITRGCILCLFASLLKKRTRFNGWCHYASEIVRFLLASSSVSLCRTEWCIFPFLSSKLSFIEQALRSGSTRCMEWVWWCYSDAVQGVAREMRGRTDAAQVCLCAHLRARGRGLCTNKRRCTRPTPQTLQTIPEPAPLPGAAAFQMFSSPW